MADNAPAPDVPQPAAAAPAAQQQPREEFEPFFVVAGLLFGVVLGQLYIDFLVPRLAIEPVTYPQANFQNKTSNYYDVLNITYDANATDIEVARDALLSELATAAITTSTRAVNLTGMAKMEDVKQAYRYLQGLGRCMYDFEFLGLGFLRYLRCWYEFYYISYTPSIRQFLESSFHDKVQVLLAGVLEVRRRMNRWI
jgi:hypothetical protein